jgi:hypothetical protein
VLDYKLEKASGILIIEPKAPLTVDDFKALTADVDRYLASHDTLTGILLGVAHVPGSENFAALIQHMRFVRDRQKRIARVAVLADDLLENRAGDRGASRPSRILRLRERRSRRRCRLAQGRTGIERS